MSSSVSCAWMTWLSGSWLILRCAYTELLTDIAVEAHRSVNTGQVLPQSAREASACTCCTILLPELRCIAGHPTCGPPHGKRQQSCAAATGAHAMHLHSPSLCCGAAARAMHMRAPVQAHACVHLPACRRSPARGPWWMCSGSRSRMRRARRSPACTAAGASQPPGV